MQPTDRLTYVVSEKDEGKKISRILKDRMKLSSGMIRVVKYNEGVLLNGENVRVNHLVKCGDVITVLLNCRQDETDIIPTNMPIDILYEDDAMLVCNKPPYMVSHPVRNHLDDTLLNAVVYRMNEEGKKHGIHLVTRLDKDTSGIVIIAKNPYVQEQMKLQGERKVFVKKYLGITEGQPVCDSGLIDAPIARKEEISMERTVHEEGYASVTEYKVIERYENHALVEFRPITGRTHQIRVHCLYENFPLLGDALYNKPCSFMERQALHAYKVKFIHPVINMPMEIQAPLPKDMADALDMIKGCKPRNHQEP